MEDSSPRYRSGTRDWRIVMWTRFFDMNSGGDQKLAWSHIYIEAPEDKAKGIFERLFNRDPENVTRQCCGPDYSISEEIDLQQGTAYERGCEFVHFDSGNWN